MTEREKAIELQQRLMAKLYAKRAQAYGDYCKQAGDKAESFRDWVRNAGWYDYTYAE
ncbi:MAG TPA: hypothetical protein PLP25_00140 [Candidatus Limiplasma sp.]|nr:hypothetical protein [Candidatus Limiplasma sp.]